MDLRSVAAELDRIPSRLNRAVRDAADPTLQWERASIAILVFAGYYLGAQLGLALTFEPLPISVLWPPNAILLAALVLIPSRNWWVVVAAALPAHLASELPAGIPVAMVLCWFVSNIGEALIGATLLRRFADNTRPFDTPRYAIVFFASATAAAVLSSFLDSAFVRLNGWGTMGYWELWRARVVSNLVADAVIVPALVAGITVVTRPIRPFTPPRMAEGLLLAACLAITAFLVFDTHMGASAPTGQIYLPVPLLIWAAYRFGPAAVSIAFGVVILLAVWGAAHGLGAFSTGTPLENVSSLQLFALCIGPTVLSFAAAIAERNRAERSITDGYQRFRLLLGATKDTVYERDLATSGMRLTHAELLCPPPDGPRCVKTFEELVARIHPDDRHRIIEIQESALRDGPQQWECDFRFRRGDGTWLHLHEDAYIVRDSYGRAAEVVGRLSDVTERHDTEELSHRLSQASRLTAMGELAASIAHEINQPMGAILSNVDAADLLLDKPDLDRKELRAIIDDIRSDDLRASEIIRHIRNLANKRGVEMDSFDLNELVRSVLRLAAPTARRRGLSAHAKFGAIPKVLGDQIHIQQVLLNLLLNAMDAMRDMRVAHPSILITTSVDGPAMVRVSVLDSGHGIGPDQLDRIFDSFFTTKSDGMGLGLSISRSLVLAHGGRIWAQNNRGGGAIVSFTLPAAPPPSAP
jgi:signal transduction histidine kinase/integral membrane sensor domain MASE1